MPMNLSPISAIDAKLDTPIHIPVVQAHSLYSQIEEEIKAISDDFLPTYMDAQEIWEKSVDPSIVEQYEEIQQNLEDKYNLYDEDEHSKENEAISKEIIELENKRDALFSSCGTHICYNCVFCHIKSDPIHLAICIKDEHHDIVIRPHAIACPAFSRCLDKLRIKSPIAKSHRFALKEKSRYFKDKPLPKESQKDILIPFVSALSNNKDEAFGFYKKRPQLTISLFTTFPEAFSDSPFPSFNDFLKAYNKWEKNTPNNNTIHNDSPL